MEYSNSYHYEWLEGGYRGQFKRVRSPHLIGVGDEKRALPRAVVVQHVHDLYRGIGLSGSGGPHDHRQSGLDARHYRLRL